MAEVKRFEEWEQIYGYMHEQADPNLIMQTITEDEFRGYIFDEYGNPLPTSRGVSYDVRIDWLNNNGYEVTRVNMLNHELPSNLSFTPNTEQQPATDTPLDDDTNVSVI